MSEMKNAAEHGDLEKMRQLVEDKHVSPDLLLQPYSETAVLTAAFFNQPEILIYLLEIAGANVNARSDGNVGALYHAAQQNHSDCIRILLHYKADPNIALYHSGDTPLTAAAQRGHLECVAALVEDSRCDIEQKMKHGTAILIAAEGKHWDVVEKLLEHKASLLGIDPKGRSLIRLANEGDAPPHTIELIQKALAERLAAGQGGGSSGKSEL
jgi:ankyrin repeat protein